MLGIQVEGTHPWGPRVRVEFSGVESHVWFQKWFPEACFLSFGAGTLGAYEGLQKWKESSWPVGASVSCGSWSTLGAPQDRAAARDTGIAKENFLPVFTTLQAGLLCGSAQTQS